MVVESSTVAAVLMGFNMRTRHRVFISYHHALDQGFKEDFVRAFSHVFEDWSVRIGDIDTDLATETVRQKVRDEWLRDSTVTIVLIGRDTWKRKHVDWEIGSSLRDTAYNPRSGLMGIITPNYGRVSSFTANTIPPRLADNVKEPDPFARIYPWPPAAEALSAWIHTAFVRRNQMPAPDNSRSWFRYNRSGASWE